jgi:hypothetical protein
MRQFLVERHSSSFHALLSLRRSLKIPDCPACGSQIHGPGFAHRGDLMCDEGCARSYEKQQRQAAEFAAFRQSQAPPSNIRQTVS